MRSLSLSLAILVFSGAACVSVDPVDTRPPPELVYYRPAKPLRQYHSPVKRRSTARPSRSVRGGQTWYPRGGRVSPRWTTIVVHHSATTSGSAKTFDRFHRKKKGWDELGYHFVIGNGSGAADGLIEIGPRWHKQKHGAHCKTPSNYYNEHGIGICLVGDFTRTRPTRRQLESLERLVRFLSDACHIPPSKITTHGAVSRKTQCPGRHFPLLALRRAMSSRPTASSYP